MNYLTTYYKNLCEDLQAKIDLLEAGLKKAMKTGDPELLAKEGMKAGERWERLEQQAGEESSKSLQATRRFGPTSKQAVVPAFKSEIARGKAERVMQNILDIDQQLDAESPEVRKASSKKYVTQANLEKYGLSGPDVHDGPDPDTTGSTSEVIASQRRNQYKGSIKESIVPQKSKPIRLPPPPGTFDHPGDILTRTDEWGQEVDVTEDDPLDVILGSWRDKKEKGQKSYPQSILPDIGELKGLLNKQEKEQKPFSQGGPPFNPKNFEKSNFKLPKGDFEKHLEKMKSKTIELSKGDFEKQLEKMKGKTTNNKSKPGNRLCDPFPCPEDLDQDYTPGTHFPHTGSSQY